MGYTHYWTQHRAFTDAEWQLILGEARRIVAKAARGDYYTGKEDAASQADLHVNEGGFRHGFKEPGAWRTFPHPELPIPQPGEPILLAGPHGHGKPRLTRHAIALNGKAPHDYESFILDKIPRRPLTDRHDLGASADFCKTEYRPYDAVVVSILAVAQTVAPDAIVAQSDGGPSAIRYLF